MSTNFVCRFPGTVGQAAYRTRGVVCYDVRRRHGGGRARSWSWSRGWTRAPQEEARRGPPVAPGATNMGTKPFCFIDNIQF